MTRYLRRPDASPPSYATLKRRLPAFTDSAWRAGLSAACAAHARLGPASLVLYDVSTLYFETDAGDGFRESGFSKERRLDPQITIGCPDQASGNRALQVAVIELAATGGRRGPAGRCICRPLLLRPSFG